MKNLLRFVLTIGFAFMAAPALAVPPQTINYQGDLTNAGGTPINAPVVMTFRLYNAAVGNAALYTEIQNPITVSNGSFNVVIGAVTPITLPFDVPYWLGVSVNADPEMAPRQPLASSPYAFRAGALSSTATLAGSQISGSITTATIPVANVIGAFGQAGVSVYGTVQLPVTDLTPSTVIPGLTLTIVVPANAVVLLTTHGYVRTNAVTAGVFSIVNVFLAVDGIQLSRGSTQQITPIFTGSGVTNKAFWSMSQVVTVAPGSHTFEVRAMGNGGVVGGANATVGGVALEQSPMLTAVVLKL